MNSTMNWAWADGLAKRLECVRFTGAFPWTTDRRTSKNGAQARALQTLARSRGALSEMDADFPDFSARRPRWLYAWHFRATSVWRQAARGVLLLLTIAVMAPTDQAQKAPRPPKLPHADLTVGFARKAFAGVNRNDVEAAFKAFLVTVGQRLQVIVVSPPLLDSVFCISKSGWLEPEHREAASSGLAEFDTEPQGRQILTLFKMRKIVPFKPEYLENVRKLRAAHDRLAEAALSGASRSPRTLDEGGKVP